VNVFEEQESENKFMNSGVQKVLIIAIVEDIPEKYENLRLVLEKLNLEDTTIILLLILNVPMYYLVFHRTQVKKLVCGVVANVRLI